ncbi:MAG: PDZ domain-containing protein [Ruminococcaceae bacterium]|nr:PDZ domain-containing protein [Oscillospiraceae bacterium]
MKKKRKSIAYEDTLKNRDRIISINGTEILTTTEMNDLVDAMKVGDTVTRLIDRDGETHTITMVLREYVPDYIGSELE